MGCFLSAVDRGAGPADVADEDRVGEADEGGVFLDDSRVDEFVQRGVKRGGHMFPSLCRYGKMRFGFFPYRLRL